jgi:D-hydantoinase
MPVDTVVKNCKVVRPTGIRQEGLAIDKGKIVAIAHEAHLPEAIKVIDAQGKYVIPGAIDVHVHYGVYNDFRKEIFEMNAAAYGGTTTLGCFVNFGASSQKGSYSEVFPMWKDTWEKHAVVDTFFHGGATSQTILDEVVTNAERYGITSYKMLMTCKGEEIAIIGGDPIDDGFIYTAFKSIARLGKAGRAMLHAENIDIISRLLPEVRATGRQDLDAWAEARPGFCETLDVIRAMSIGNVTKCPLYFVHLHYPDSVEVISKARAEGVDVVAETCPQYLVLNTSSDLPRPFGKINPPLRDESCNSRLWEMVRDGSIACIGSDHCSTNKEMIKDLWTANPGMPGLETMLPIMVSEGVNKGKISLEKMVEILCYNNARVFGLYPQKGAIEVGSDADIVVIDVEKKVKLEASQLHYKISDYTPYEGWEITGWPILTMVRGNVVVENNQMVTKPGWGRYIPRSLSSRN